ncbi:MAG: phenylacetate--CoA ligase family protein [Deltaproteobacteria bacterium]|nr:phenylacetate--CoA ligase family protein [Deltaproteobacteria bacterium]
MDRRAGFLNEALERKSWDEQRAAQAERLREVIAHAVANAPAVAATFRGAGLEPGDIRSLEDLARIPVTPKARLVELQKSAPPFGGLLAVPLDQVRRIFRSPGPIYDPQGLDEGWGWEEALFAAGFRRGDVCINTFGYQMTPAGMMFDDALGSLGCPLVPTGVGDREAQVEIMRALGVRGFAGMASFLLQIGEKAKEQGLDPRRDLGLEVAFTTAEPLSDALRSTVEDLFGLTLRQGFGTADCGCLAYECVEKGGMHLASRAIVEIADPETGAPLPAGDVGEVVVTLFNRAYPLLRFGTGDLSALEYGVCGCGRRSPKLRGWLGRSDQLVKVKGMFLHPGQVQAALRDFAEVARYRAVVTRAENRDLLTVKVEVAGAPDVPLRERLEARLREVLSIGASVEWVDPGTLPADGKVLEDLRTWD